MKRTKVIALVLCAAIMMMGAGYAAWTDTLNVTNTVNTGHLDVQFVDLPDETELTLPAYTTGNVAYAQDGIGEWDIAHATINNVYPGGAFSIRYKMQNNSTMPVKISSLGLSRYEDWVAAAGGVMGQGEGISSGIIGLKVFAADGIQLTDLAVPNAHPWNPDVLKGGIPVGGYIEIYVNFGAGENYAEDTKYEVTMAPIFEQFNK